jgi:hypothetical protein
MRATQLYIKETGKYIQLGQDGDFPFTLSKSIAEIQDVSKRNKTFSKSFKIPATEDNVKALGYPHVIGTDLDAVNVYKQQCFIIVNGNVIDDGYVYILKARRDTDAIEFECQFVGGNEAWVVALQSLKMSDAVSNTSGGGITVTYTDANIRARYNTDPTTLADPSYIFVTPYIHMFNDGSIGQTIGATNTKIGRSRNARGQDFWPAFRVDYLVDAIFGTATNPLVQQVFGFDSFELDSDFLTDNATHGFWNNIYYSDRSEDEYPNVTFNGSASNWGNFLPQDVSMLDFFMKLVRTFNLVFSFDGITLKVEPRQDWKSWNGTTYDGFYSGDIDWSEKVSVSQEIQYKTSNYKRQIRLTYEQDSYPLSGQQYPFLEDDMVSQPELRYIVDTENNNQEGITDIVLPFNFSPSKFYQGRFDYYRSHNQYSTLDGGLDKEEGESFRADNKFANRLFVFKVGSKPTGVEWYDPSAGAGDPDGLDEFAQDTRWRDWIYEDAGGTLYYNDDYPFIYNCITVNPYSGSNITVLGVSIYYVTDIDDTDEALSVDVTDVTVTKDATFNFITNVESNSIDDINLGIYKSNTVDMPDGLYERFWKTTIDQLITTRTLVTQVLMTRNEFVSLDISKYYTLMGQRFILNKVKDFDPMLDEQMVEVELLAVDAFRSSEEQEGGENIVTDGLIFRVDAGDTDSYGGTGTTWTDVINGNNGTINNGASYNSAQGGYFEFDGVDDQVDFGQPAILESFPMSIDLWFYAEADNDGLITKGTTRGSTSLRDWDITGAGLNLGWFVSNGSGYPVNVKDTYPSLNNWHHLSVSWDGTTATNGAKMYLDGALFTQGTATASTYSTLRNIFVGGNRAGFYFDGRISMVKMYNKVLSAAEALQNYNASKDRYGL